MKKIIMLIFTFVMVFVFSIPVFASTDLNVLLPDLFLNDETDSIVGTIDYNALPDAEKPFYNDVMNAVSGKPYDSNYCYYVIANGYKDNKDLLLLRVPSNVKLDTKLNSLALDKPNVITKSLLFTYYAKASNNGIIRYRASQNNSSISSGVLPYSLSSLSSVTSVTSICILASSPNAVAQTLNSANFPNFYNNTFKGKLMFRDNNPEQPAPTPDPEPPIEPPQFPEIPQGDSDFVLYDTSVWQRFLKFVSGNIGSATNIGLLIFAVVFGIGLVISIVRKFSNKG